jgi:hypothetical protein
LVRAAMMSTRIEQTPTPSALLGRIGDPFRVMILDRGSFRHFTVFSQVLSCFRTVNIFKTV